ncbi:MAG: helix-turn-helix domain-containing protein [Hoeflea sp.]|uniref:helix-turn-helix domain-containing protein n=1 Tax=Hoeflea sp. TaxID=1940281 RepID=UPI003EFAE839
MALQCRKTSRPGSAAAGTHNDPARHSTPADALAGSLLSHETLLATAQPECRPVDCTAPDVAEAPHRGFAVQADGVCCNSFTDTLRCRVTWRLVAELFAAACDRDLPEGAARRRPRCHMRQIAMYLSHVVLSLPYQSIATAFGRDRTTVMHACAVVEDRRDDAGYDRFVEQCERCIKAVFAPLENDDAEL